MQSAPLLGATAGMSGLTAALAASGLRRRERLDGRWFAVSTLLVAVWAAASAAGLSLSLERPAVRVALGGVAVVAAVAAPVAWVTFAATHAGRWTDPRRTRRRVALLSVVPSLGVADVVLRPGVASHGGTAGSRLAAGAGDHGALSFASAVSGWLLVVAGAVVLSRTAVEATDHSTGRVLALAVGAVGPVVSVGLAAAGPSPVRGADAAAFGVGLAGAALAGRLDDTGGSAAGRTGRAAVAEHRTEGVVVVDADGIVVDADPTVASLVGAEQVVGVPVERGLAPAIDAVADDHGTIADLDGETVRVGDGWVEIRVSARSDAPGRVLTLRDVSERRARKQRLQVIYRLLRHNFRNEVTVVHGFAELLAERLDGRDGEMAERVHEVAAELVERVEKAASVERVAVRGDVAPDVVDVAAVARAVADELGGVHDVDITITVRDSPALARIVADDAERVLRNLLENAVEHNDTDTPTVTVTVDGGEDRVEVAVADDGPGIPEHERRVIDLGRETDLEHGSGMGLWLVHWCVRAAGGDIRFEDNDPRGTVVRVELPAADTDAETSTGRAVAGGSSGLRGVAGRGARLRRRVARDPAED